MSDDWYRRTSWDEDDQLAFFERLGLCRSDSTRTQSLRTQAGTLANHSLVAEAIELYGQLLAEHPDDYFRGMAYCERADCYCQIGDTEQAIADFREALRVQSEECPNVVTPAWIDFPWMIVSLGITDLYGEAITVLEAGEQKDSLVFPVTKYRTEAVRAIILADTGEASQAERHATAALEAANREHSGLTYHASVGLVTDQMRKSPVHSRLLTLASGGSSD